MVGMRTETLMASSRSGVEAGGREGGVRRFDGRSRRDLAGHRVQGLEAVAGVDDDGLERGVELTRLDQLLEHRDAGAAGGLGEDPLGPREQDDALAHLVVTDVL